MCQSFAIISFFIPGKGKDDKDKKKRKKKKLAEKKKKAQDDDNDDLCSAMKCLKPIGKIMSFC